MNLYILRHGEAGSATGMGDDSLRPLTPEGIEKLQRQAQTVLKWGFKIDLILSSPYTRTQQTAQIVADAYQRSVTLDERLAAGRFHSRLLGAILSDHQAIENLMLVGHEPDCSSVVGAIIGDAQLEFGKGALACVDIARLSPASGTLIALLPPVSMGA